MDGLARAWQDMSRLSELLNNAGEEDACCFDSDAAEDRIFDNSLLSRRMNVLGLNAGEIARTEPGIFLDLRSACFLCGSRAQCDADLKHPSRGDDNSDANGWRDYCPNAATLNMLSSLHTARRAMAQRVA
ncbi:MAG: hypothetical protein HY659_05725 [Rhizobiales bacterium]|nr:hypothetical protein [Hyphomicrobiales bacterium]